MEPKSSRFKHRNNDQGDQDHINFMDFCLQENIEFLELDWKEIASLDLDKIVRTRNTQVLLNLLPQILFCKAEAEFDPNKTDPSFRKVFKLSQLILQYVLEKYKALDLQLINLQNENDNIKGEIKAITDELRKCNNAKIEQINKCIYCGKRFANSSFLQSHMHRRHQGLPPDPSTESNGSFTSHWTIEDEQSEAEVYKKQQTGELKTVLAASSSTQTDLSFPTPKEIEQKKLCKIIHCIEFLSENCNDIEIISKSQMERIYAGFQLYHENLDKRLDQIQEIAEDLEQSKQSMSIQNTSFLEKPSHSEVSAEVPDAHVSLCQMLEQQLEGQDKQIARIRQFIQQDMAQREMEAIKKLKAQDEKVQSGFDVIQSLYKGKLEEVRKDINKSLTNLKLTMATEDHEIKGSEATKEVLDKDKSWISESDTQSDPESYKTSIVFKPKKVADKPSEFEFGFEMDCKGRKFKAQHKSKAKSNSAEFITNQVKESKHSSRREKKTLDKSNVAGFSSGSINKSCKDKIPSSSLAESKLLKQTKPEIKTNSQINPRKQEQLTTDAMPSKRKHKATEKNRICEPSANENFELKTDRSMAKSNFEKLLTHFASAAKKQPLNKKGHAAASTSGLDSKTKYPSSSKKDFATVVGDYNLSSNSETTNTEPTLLPDSEDKKRLSRTKGFAGMFDSEPEDEFEKSKSKAFSMIETEDGEYTDGMKFFGLARPNCSSFNIESEMDGCRLVNGDTKVDSGRGVKKLGYNFRANFGGGEGDFGWKGNMNTSTSALRPIGIGGASSGAIGSSFTNPNSSAADYYNSLKTILNRIQFKRTPRDSTTLSNFSKNIRNILSGPNFPGPNPELCIPYKAAAQKESKDGSLKPIIIKSRPKKWNELK